MTSNSQKLFCDKNHKQNNSIKETFNLEPIMSVLKYVDQNSLIIFDVDDVLIIPTPEHDFRHPYRINMLKSISKQLTSNEIEILKSIIFVQREVALLDPDINKLFDLLRSVNAPSVALTAMGTGKFGVIDSLVEIRINELNKFNIGFEQITPLQGKCIVKDLNNFTKIFSDARGFPCLDSGIIFTAGIDKGVVLEYILHKYNHYPKTIIFVDDYLPNLESLNQLCIKLAINFHGFYYKAASLVPLPKINEKLETLRFKILAQEYLWLNYNKLNRINKKNKHL